METARHRDQMEVLIRSLQAHWSERHNYYVGGNMFLYHSREQPRQRQKVRGPDFFFVQDVDGTRERRYWWVFEEGGKYPDTIIELLSPSTAEVDRTTKKDLYEQTFRTPGYFCYDPETRKLEGWRLNGQFHYQALVPNERGWLWSAELGLWLGTWEGVYLEQQAVWLRFYTPEGALVLIEAESEHHRAEHEHQRAEALAAEVARLQALLREKGIPPETGA